MPKIKAKQPIIEQNNFEENTEDECQKEYNYLLQMPIWNLSYEKVEEIKQQCQVKEEELLGL